MLENWPFNCFFRSKCFLSHQIRLQASIFPLRGVVFLRPVFQSVGMSLYAVLFTSTGCGDYSITTFMLHFWTAQGYVIYWVILLFFWEIKCLCSPSLSQRAGRSCCSGPPSHTQAGFRWACLPLYRALRLCQANSNRLKKKSSAHLAHLHILWATRLRPSLGWDKMWPSFEWKTLCQTVYSPFVSF